MAGARGFQEVLNGNANGAGIVLPDSETENSAIDNIARQNYLQQQQQRQAILNNAQANKDMATNKINVHPGLLFNNEISKLSQDWFDNGVKYRKQGVNPFDPSTGNVYMQHVGDQHKIQDLADLRDAINKDYTDKQKLAQEGSVEGFDDYDKFLKTHSLQQIQAMGGEAALPQLTKPIDLSKVDNSYHLAPQTKEIDQETGIPGVTNTVTHKYVNMPQAAANYEQLFNSQPGAPRFYQKAGIGNPKQLYTYNGQNMMRDKNNVEDFGHIDEKGIYHQMTQDYLTHPELIKQLPEGVKQKIVQGFNGPDVNPWTGGAFNTQQAVNGATKTPYQPANDPEFQKFIDGKFDQQIKKERDYQTNIISGVQRKLPSVALGDESKLNSTMAQLEFRKQAIAQGQQRIGMEGQRLALEQKKWQSHLADAGTREKWITDIAAMNPDAIHSLNAAIGEVHGRIVPRRGGITVQIPESVPNVQPDGTISTAAAKKQIMHEYPIDKFSGRAGRIRIEQILNKLPTFGKEKGLKTEPYSTTTGSYDNTNADDNSADNL